MPKIALVDGELNLRDGLVLRIALERRDLRARSSAIARRSTPTLSMSIASALMMSPISGSRSHARPDKRLILDPDEFYILASQEKLHIPPDLAAEMVPIDPAMGEFRVHYAGFFDPGFGYTEERPSGQPRRSRSAQPRGALHPRGRAGDRPARLSRKWPRRRRRSMARSAARTIRARA